MGGGKDVSVRLIDFLGKTSPGALLELSASGNNELVLAPGQQTFALVDTDGSYQGIDSLAGANEIYFDAGVSKGRQVFALNIGNAGGKTVALANVEAAVLAGPGTIRNDGSNAIIIASDNKAQKITGGTGNDTLIGSGNDTLTGGGGSDIFGFNKGGHYRVTDFNKAVDKLAFDVVGVTTIEQLKLKVTGVSKIADGITYHFGPDNSITLVGISASDLSASLFKFTF